MKCKTCGQDWESLMCPPRCICGTELDQDDVYKELLDKKDMKDYNSKPIYHDVPIKAVAELGKVTLAAKKKYGNTNTWRNVDSESSLRYANATMRHLLAFLGGEVIDPETGIDHRILAMWNTGASWETEQLWNQQVRQAFDELQATDGD